MRFSAAEVPAMKSHFAIAAALLFLSAPARAQDARDAATASPYLQGSPVWGSPYVSGPVLGGVFYDGPTDEATGARVFAPVPGVSCSLTRHACWTPTGIDRGWTARFFGLK